MINVHGTSPEAPRRHHLRHARHQRGLQAVASHELGAAHLRHARQHVCGSDDPQARTSTETAAAPSRCRGCRDCSDGARTPVPGKLGAHRCVPAVARRTPCGPPCCRRRRRRRRHPDHRRRCHAVGSASCGALVSAALACVCCLTSSQTCPGVSILNFDKNRRDVSKSQSKWTAYKMETPGSPG
jgi:hypothetical protein